MVELAVPPGHPGRKDIKYLFLGNRFNEGATERAPAVGVQPFAEIEMIQYFLQLRVRLQVLHQIAGSHSFAFQKTPIPGQDGSMFFQGSMHDFRVIPVIRIRYIESKESKVSSQFPQMDIQDEGRTCERGAVLFLHSQEKVYPGQERSVYPHPDRFPWLTVRTDFPTVQV